MFEEKKFPLMFLTREYQIRYEVILDEALRFLECMAYELEESEDHLGMYYRYIWSLIDDLSMVETWFSNGRFYESHPKEYQDYLDRFHEVIKEVYEDGNN